MPRGGRAKHVKLLNKAEKLGVWPWQFLMVIVVLLLKPGPASAGDRSIGLLANIARWWARSREGVSKKWVQERRGHWDKAIAGSPALRVALLTAFADEAVDLAQLQHLCSASVLWDIRGFYGSIDWEEVSAAASRLEFPPVPMFLEVLLHMAPRFLKKDGSLSKTVQPRRSIVAGSLRGPRPRHDVFCPRSSRCLRPSR